MTHLGLLSDRISMTENVAVAWLTNAEIPGKSTAPAAVRKTDLGL
jgi:hypothetical protein